MIRATSGDDITMDAIDVVLFGRDFQDSQILRALLEDGHWPVRYLDGEDFIRHAGIDHQALALCVLGRQASAQHDETGRIVKALQTTRPNASRLCLLSADSEPLGNRFFSCFDDFIFWPCAAGEFHTRLKRFLSRPPGAAAAATLGSALKADFASLDLVGQSPAFMKVLALIEKLARCNATVLIEGETGTGKENVARAMHYLSQRSESGFIPVNCGAIPDDLLESELFGHSRGAFTDAKTDQPGLVAMADGGTLFLDEVDSLSGKAQAALLRFLQTHEYRRLGDRQLKQADVRILAATNADLEQRVRQGQFRKDLLFRLKVLTLNLPPLRQRPEDIAVITQRLLSRFASQYNSEQKTLHPRCLEWLQQQHWPGNVRELENVLLRGFLLTEGHLIQCRPGAEEQEVGQHAPHPDLPANFHHAKEAAVQAFEQRYLQTVLELAGGNVSAAARIAGKERRAMGKLIKKYNIDKSQYGLAAAAHRETHHGH